MGIIYLITNTINQRRYVGKTECTLQRRWNNHKHSAKRGSSSYFHKALRKYSADSFVVHTLACFENSEVLKQAEILFIAELQTLAPQGYNLTEGGDGTRGWIPTADTRLRMSAAKLGTKQPPEQIRNRIASLISGGKRIRTICKRGHLRTPTNLYKSGACRVCRRETHG